MPHAAYLGPLHPDARGRFMSLCFISPFSPVDSSVTPPPPARKIQFLFICGSSFPCFRILLALLVFCLTSFFSPAFPFRRHCLLTASYTFRFLVRRRLHFLPHDVLILRYFCCSVITIFFALCHILLASHCTSSSLPVSVQSSYCLQLMVSVRWTR